MRIAGLTVTAALVGLAVAAQAQAPASAPGTPGATARQAPASNAKARPTTAKPSALPRTADGHPDFQGNWTNATITPMERLRANVPLVLTEEAAQLDERNTAAALEAREAPSDPNRGAPPVGGEVRKSPNAEPTYLELLWRAGDVFTAIERGQLILHIHQTFPLAEAAAAHRALESRSTTGKLILKISELASNARE